MKKIIQLDFVIVILLTLALAQAGRLSALPSAAGAHDDNLQAVISQMNQGAASFQSAQADVEWEQYTKVVDQKDLQKGHIYFRRNKKDLDVAIKIDSPAAKHIVFKDGKIRVYDSRLDQLTERSVGKDKSDVDAVVNLGFGGSGDELLASYSVKLLGWETVDGIKVAKLELVPNSEKIKRIFNRVLLWIDPVRDVALKQQSFEPSGDYHLVHNTNILVNPKKLPKGVFDLQTTSHTTIIKP